MYDRCFTESTLLDEGFICEAFVIRHPGSRSSGVIFIGRLRHDRAQAILALHMTALLFCDWANRGPSISIYVIRTKSISTWEYFQAILTFVISITV
jgi:hypothetical protein